MQRTTLRHHGTHYIHHPPTRANPTVRFRMDTMDKSGQGNRYCIYSRSSAEADHFQERIGKGNKKKKKLNDIEPLPTPLLLSTLLNSSMCSVEQMTDIECLTVDGKHPKDLDFDVECSLERGLICKTSNSRRPCPDFKIKVSTGYKKKISQSHD